MIGQGKIILLKMNKYKLNSSIIIGNAVIFDNPLSISRPKILPLQDGRLNLHAKIHFLRIVEQTLQLLPILAGGNHLIIGILVCTPGRCTSLQ